MNSEEIYKVYKGILLAQVKDIEDLFLKIFTENNITQIVEIGTNRGGLSIWLSDHAPESCQILTLDINESYIEYDQSDYSHNLVFKQINCFSNEGIDLIKAWINKDGQTLLLCDGGAKNNEFNLFSEYLKPNDVIMLHDYSDANNNLWHTSTSKYGWYTSPESNFEAIRSNVEKHNLSKYLYEYSCSYLWGCFKKTK